MTDGQELLKPAEAASERQPVDMRPHPLELLRTALQSGADADAIQKISALAQEWEDREARKAFAVSMNRAQSEMPVVVKDAVNSFTQSPYPRLETMQEIARPIYTQHGFSINWGTEDCPLPEHIRMVATVRHTSGHSEQFRGDIPLDGSGAKGGQSAMNAPQATGSTYSYGQRYMLKLVFNLTVAGEDNDAAGKVETITPDQQAAMQDLMEHTGTDLKKMLAWIQPGLKTLAEMPAARLADAMDMLKRKAAAQGGGDADH